MAIIIGIVDGFVIYMVWSTTLPIGLRLTIMILLFGMYLAIAAGMIVSTITTYSRCVMLYRDLYTFNHSVNDDIPQKPEEKSTENVDALS